MNTLARWTRGAGIAAALALTSALAGAQTWTATLSGPAEAPPNASPGTGFATFTLLGNALRINGTFSGLIGTTTVTHIHCCTAAAFAGAVGVTHLCRAPASSGAPSLKSSSWSSTTGVAYSKAVVSAGSEASCSELRSRLGQQGLWVRAEHATNRRDLLYADSVAGHLLKTGRGVALPATHRNSCSKRQMLTELFPSGLGWQSWTPERDGVGDPAE